MFDTNTEPALLNNGEVCVKSVWREVWIPNRRTRGSELQASRQSVAARRVCLWKSGAKAVKNPAKTNAKRKLRVESA